jgi:gliding motility-associated-like protein
MLQYFCIMQKSISIKLFFLCLFSAALSSNAAITIDSVSTVASSCANNGSITIHAQNPSGSSIYSIFSGPDIRPPQSGNSFSGLPSGIYQVLVTNLSNDSAKATAMVGGSYQFPDFTPTLEQPLCVGSATGIIRGNPQPGLGTPPFMWTLTPLSGGAPVTQASHIFNNLPAGTYSIRMVDACQSFATRSLTLSDPNTSLVIQNVNDRMVDCDSADIYIEIYAPGARIAMPLYVSIQTATNTFYDTINGYQSQSYFNFTVGVNGVDYGDYANITIKNSCGDVVTMKNRFAPFDFPNVGFTQKTDSCAIKYLGTFSNRTYVTDEFPTLLHTPITIVVKNAATLATVDSTVYKDSVGYVYYVHTKPLVSGVTYQITIKDTCGNFYSKNVTWPAVPVPSISASVLGVHCRDSTAGLQVSCYNFLSTPKMVITSGPPIVQSRKSGFAHRDTITYPIVFDTPNCQTSGPLGLSGLCFSLGNLGVGTYTYTVSDSCGTIFSSSVTVTRADVSDYTYSRSIKKGCPGENQIRFTSSGFMNGAFSAMILDLSTGYIITYSNKQTDTILNLNHGSYVVSINPNSTFLPITQDAGCTVMRDTIIIPVYELPRIDRAVQIKCNGLVNVGLQPDSTKGVPPYRYEIVSGPQIASVQVSNFFGLTQPGAYVARISDTCGFARTFTFSVDTLSFEPVVKVGSSCAGDSVMLILDASPYSSYRWQRPNGALYTGDTLKINPVTPLDYGTYHITKYVSVNNCTDTFSVSYLLNSSKGKDTTVAICAGQSFSFAGNIYSQSGTYYDTIPTITCDSIITLHLNISAPKQDTITRGICAGQSVTFGGNTYSQPGIYRDTFATITCDSISVLVLNARTQIRDTINRSICTGQSYTLGTKTYTQTGVYTDTFNTTGCDSIVLLRLNVSDAIRDTLVRTICPGQSVTIGGNTYSQTGIYRDTFLTIGCDSIVVLRLTASPYKRDTIARGICTGESVSFGGQMIATPGTYSDTLATSSCDSIITLQLTATGLKRDTITHSICAGGSYNFNGQLISTSGSYADTIATAACDSVITLILSVTDLKRDTAFATICNGDSLIWNGEIIKQAGSYSDTIATIGCDSISTVIISISMGPDLAIIVDKTKIKEGETISLSGQSTTATSFLWQPDSLFANNMAKNTVADLSQSGWIMLTASDIHNCSAYDSIYITVEKDSSCDGGNVFVPNVFTPNGDGLNDIFYIYGRNVKLIELQIFNRWGELVFESHDLEYGWDGYFRSQEQPSGVFVYFMKYLACDGYRAKVLKGSLNLIK